MHLKMTATPFWLKAVPLKKKKKYRNNHTAHNTATDKCAVQHFSAFIVWSPRALTTSISFSQFWNVCLKSGRIQQKIWTIFQQWSVYIGVTSLLWQSGSGEREPWWHNPTVSLPPLLHCNLCYQRTKKQHSLLKHSSRTVGWFLKALWNQFRMEVNHVY